MLNAVIIDDERKSRENLEVLLHSFVKDVSIVATADGVNTGVRAIQENKPDVVFLDIHLTTGDGFEILERLNGKAPNIIFVTGHEEHAVKAFRSDAIDYLLKPVDINLLQNAVNRVKEQKALRAKVAARKSTKKHQITLSTSKGLIFLNSDDILYCKGDGAYTYFFLKSGERITTSKNLKSYEEMLNEHRFFRTHKSYLINLNEMKTYVRGDGGHVVMTNGDSVGVSKRRRENFLAALSSA